MSGKIYLLDTNIIIALFAEDASVIKQIEKAEKVFIPVIVLGELFYGAELSARKTENIKKLESFAEVASLIYLTYNTPRFYGQIKSQLKKSGNPIPENDIWIAALSVENNLPLASRDKHFKAIKSMSVVHW